MPDEGMGEFSRTRLRRQRLMRELLPTPWCLLVAAMAWWTRGLPRSVTTEIWRWVMVAMARAKWRAVSPAIPLGEAARPFAEMACWCRARRVTRGLLASSGYDAQADRLVPGSLLGRVNGKRPEAATGWETAKVPQPD